MYKLCFCFEEEAVGARNRLLPQSRYRHLGIDNHDANAVNSSLMRQLFNSVLLFKLAKKKYVMLRL